ncbi:APC membrane recruitment protein 2 [Lepisosteus oculatus]|uniref:APC membrane recruitment protein 2 n=1 Tax=Lepisosteus oculatus TaxID=7918 RepID=UPI003722B8AF
METSRSSRKRASAGAEQQQQQQPTHTADMDPHCECSEPPPPAEPQPAGKINKAAFKLFGKRRAGSAVPSIFGVKSKGEGKGPGKTGLVRSRTHDGLAEAVLEGGRKEASSSSEQMSAALPGRTEAGPAPAAGGSVSKSLSFFSLLRKSGRAEGSRGENGEHRAGSRQRRGLRGLFSSMRWHRKDKQPREEREGAREAEPEAPRSGGSELAEEPGQRAPCSEPPPPAREPAEEPAAAAADQPPAAGDCGSPLPALRDGETRHEEEVAEAGRSPEPEPEPEPEPGVPTAASPARAWEDSAAAEPREEPAPTEPRPSGPDAAPRATAPAMTVTPPEPSAPQPPSEPSIDRLCSLFADVTSLKSFDSLTGCGDIIAEPEEEGGSGGSNGTGSSSGGGAGAGGGGGGGPGDKGPPAPVRIRAAPKKAQGGGVVAYQGGGEEMASPDEVDEADLREFWDLLPQAAEPPSAEPPRAEPPVPPQPRPPPPPPPPRRAEPARQEKGGTPPVKALGLSKIPVSGGGGGGRAGKTHKEAPESRDKEAQDGVPNSDEGYWDSTTPGPEEEGGGGGGGGGGFLARGSLLRDSCSGDALFDLYVDPDEPPAGAASDEEVSAVSARQPELTPPSQSTFRSLKGSTSLPRDSRIPVSVRQVPSHSASQGALVPNHTPAGHHPPARTEPPRTKIPVSRVPVKKSSNKTLSSRIPSHLDHCRK